jgi:hypothetical protein
MNKQKQKFFKLTPELRAILKEEIENKMATAVPVLTWTSIRQGQKETGFPVSWYYLDRICKKPVREINIGFETIFKLFDFFGYELTSFVLEKREV